jgi:hypothetical protein
MAQSAYVASGYERIENDNYQTIDSRCVKALMDSWPINGKIIDCCSPSGSGIVDELNKYKAIECTTGVEDAFSKFQCDWIVTNPPYARPLVDDIASECLSKLYEGNIRGIAMLMRANWDFAKTRANFFTQPWYNAQIRMRFRPWWSEDRTASPVHNFVWHIWEKHDNGDPIIKYWP